MECFCYLVASLWEWYADKCSGFRNELEWFYGWGLGMFLLPKNAEQEMWKLLHTLIMIRWSKNWYHMLYTKEMNDIPSRNVVSIMAWESFDLDISFMKFNR